MHRVNEYLDMIFQVLIRLALVEKGVSSLHGWRIADDSATMWLHSFPIFYC